MDPFEHLWLAADEETRALVRKLAGQQQIALWLAQRLAQENNSDLSAANVAEVLRLTGSGASKRLKKIKGKKSAKSGPKPRRNGPKRS